MCFKKVISFAIMLTLSHTTRTQLELNPKTPDEVSSPLVALLPAMQCAKYTKSFGFN